MVFTYQLVLTWGRCYKKPRPFKFTPIRREKLQIGKCFELKHEMYHTIYVFIVIIGIEAYFAYGRAVY